MAKHSPKRKQAKLPTSWDLSSLPKLKLFSAGKNGKLHYTRELDLRDMGILIAGESLSPMKVTGYVLILAALLLYNLKAVRQGH